MYNECYEKGKYIVKKVQSMIYGRQPMTQDAMTTEIIEWLYSLRLEFKIELRIYACYLMLLRCFIYVHDVV